MIIFLNLLFIVVIVGILFYALYKFGRKNHDYFKKRSVCYKKPTVFIGNTFDYYVRRTSASQYTNNLYTDFKNEKIYGLFDFSNPIIVIKDPDILKQLIVKDFDYFENHKLFLESGCDRLFGNGLFMLCGDKWRDMRATLCRAFTGSKIRLMSQFMVKSAEQTKDYISKECINNNSQCNDNNTNNNARFNCDMKDIATRYANDVIANCAFGIDINSFENRTNDFFINGKIAVNFTNIWGSLRIVFMKLFPTITKKLDIGLIDRVCIPFFRNIISNSFKYRIENNIYRPDMINIMLEIQNRSSSGHHHQQQQQHQDHQQIDNNQQQLENGNDGFATVQESSNISRSTAVKRVWSNDEIIAQCFFFFIAGYETTSSVLQYAAYELAVNPIVQEKLYQEILQTHQSLNGEPINYDAIQNLKYMDMVISEVLRKYPPLGLSDRVCSKEYLYTDAEKRTFTIDKGVVIWIPIWGFHYDSKYYPNPDRFDPERFNDENRKRINSSFYLPFGIGPRSCIASRFALIEMKFFYYCLLLNFIIEVNDKTPISLVFKKSVQIQLESSINLSFKKRN